jgi:uncharacterized membrane protein YqaE (UPF0057 family)
MKQPPLATLQQTATSAKTTARRASRKIQRAHGRVVRVSTLATEDQTKLLLAVLLPPVGVFLELGFAPEIVLNLLLTLLGYAPRPVFCTRIVGVACSTVSLSLYRFIPGILHALYILTSD